MNHDYQASLDEECQLRMNQQASTIIGTVSNFYHNWHQFDYQRIMNPGLTSGRLSPTKWGITHGYESAMCSHGTIQVG